MNPHWQFIHIISTKYPNDPNYQDAQSYRDFFESLQYVIPDSRYRQYFMMYLKKHPINASLGSNHDLDWWVTGIHYNLEPPKIDMNNLHDDICKYLWSVCQFYPQNPTVQETTLYKQFFQSLNNVIPDINFRKQYADAFVNVPIDPYLSTRNSLSMWLYKIFDQIKRMYYKKHIIVEGFDMDKTSLLMAVAILMVIAIYVKIR